jgi:hypothetical protein
MKLILSLSLLIGFLHWGSAAKKLLEREELASSMYQTASEKVTAFFQNAGTPVENYVHNSLRTADDVLHDKETAHLVFYKDDHCTQVDFIIDGKINRCAVYLGNLKPLILSDDGTTLITSLQAYDETCMTPLGNPLILAFQKNVCTNVGGTYVTLDLLQRPKKQIPGGGAAIVFYDTVEDCPKRKVNLDRANLMITWPLDVCTTGFVEGYGFVQAIHCDKEVAQFIPYGDETCSEASEGDVVSYATDPRELGCPTCAPFGVPYQVLCIEDSPSCAGGGF